MLNLEVFFIIYIAVSININNEILPLAKLYEEILQSSFKI